MKYNKIFFDLIEEQKGFSEKYPYHSLDERPKPTDITLNDEVKDYIKEYVTVEFKDNDPQSISAWDDQCISAIVFMPNNFKVLASDLPFYKEILDLAIKSLNGSYFLSKLIYHFKDLDPQNDLKTYLEIRKMIQDFFLTLLTPTSEKILNNSHYLYNLYSKSSPLNDDDFNMNHIIRRELKIANQNNDEKRLKFLIDIFHIYGGPYHGCLIHLLSEAIYDSFKEKKPNFEKLIDFKYGWSDCFDYLIEKNIKDKEFIELIQAKSAMGANVLNNGICDLFLARNKDFLDFLFYEVETIEDHQGEKFPDIKVKILNHAIIRNEEDLILEYLDKIDINNEEAIATSILYATGSSVERLKFILNKFNEFNQVNLEDLLWLIVTNYERIDFNLTNNKYAEYDKELKKYVHYPTPIRPTDQVIDFLLSFVASNLTKKDIEEFLFQNLSEEEIKSLILKKNHHLELNKTLKMKNIDNPVKKI